MNGIRIVFMGTPEFAVGPLKALVNAGAEIAGVVTAPDKPAGRGNKLQISAVKDFCLSELNCPILQPENLKDPEFIKELTELEAPLFLVVAFRMLPREVWSLPDLGTINLHASLLPHYRGAAPINWCLINGEKETGITTFLIDHKIDTGRILLQESVKIDPSDNAGTLHDRLMERGSALLVKTADLVIRGKAESTGQETFNIPEELLKKAPKIFKEDCRIDWNSTAGKIHNLVRGLSPLPGAYTVLTKNNSEDIPVKLFTTRVINEPHDLIPGTILSDSRNYLRIASAEGMIEVISLQVAGKKRMPAEDLLRGLKEDINLFRAE